MYLGIDYGEKRVGLASSDGSIATPIKTVENNTELLEVVSECIKEREVSVVVIGESKNFKGEDNSVMESIRSFASELASHHPEITIVFEPEYLTSHQAEKSGSKDIDASAAALILQSYLDKSANAS